MTPNELITGRLSSIEDRIAAELPGPDDAAMLIDLAAEAVALAALPEPGRGARAGRGADVDDGSLGRR